MTVYEACSQLPDILPKMPLGEAGDFMRELGKALMSGNAPLAITLINLAKNRGKLP